MPTIVRRSRSSTERCGSRWRPTPTLASLSAEGSGQSGRWPGIAEETYFALVAKQPVFVAGGLVAAADRVARALRRDWPAELTTDYQLSHTPGYEELLKAEVGTSEEELRSVLAGADLLNGLDDEENALLFETVDLDLSWR